MKIVLIALFQHLHSCEAFKFLFNLNNLPDCINDSAITPNFKSHFHQTILNNATVFACNNNYNQLSFLESLLIKNNNPTLNCGRCENV